MKIFENQGYFKILNVQCSPSIRTLERRTKSVRKARGVRKAEFQLYVKPCLTSTKKVVFERLRCSVGGVPL